MATALLSSISVGERRREDLGDIDGLAASIARYGLLHPIVVDDDGNLIAGGRRLEACTRLGWDEVPVTWLGDLSEAERREIELEENLRRKDLTPYEQAKVMVGLGAVAGEILKQQAVEFSGEAPKNPKGGQPSKSDSQANVATRLGVDQKTVSNARRHVETVDTYIPTAGPDWPQYNVLELKTHLDKLPEADRSKAADFINEPGIDPGIGLPIVKNLVAMSPQKRARVFELRASEDPRERSLAKTIAAQLPPMPDPRITRLTSAMQELQACIKPFPNDPLTNAFRFEIDHLKALAGEIREQQKANLEDELRGQPISA